MRREMRRGLVRTVIGAVLALMIGVGAHLLVSAQTQNDEGLIGSWDVTVTARDCETGTPIFSFLAVQTYNQGGTMLASNLGAPGSIRLEGHGVWEHGTGRVYYSAFRVLKYDPDGSFAGRDIIRDEITLAPRSNSFVSSGSVEILDANGNLLLRGCATTYARRFK
jgi:hypothetical protein